LENDKCYCFLKKVAPKIVEATFFVIEREVIISSWV